MAETKYNVKTRTVVVDLSSPSSRGPAFAQLESLSKELDIAVLGELPLLSRSLTLVNNAGSSHEMPVAFADTTPEELETIVQVVSDEASFS
jgi:17beta-estradiol 17-dehydrogenase / very-long-chain 3-oxoacyl-CoA reductase